VISSGSSSSAGKAWPHAVVVALASVLVLHARAIHYVGDDGMITLRYVRNLIEGKGLVFNEGERVEGYTNFLWVILVAAIDRIVHARLDIEARALGLGCAVATQIVLTRLSWKVSGNRGLLSFLAPVLLASSTAYVAWAEAMLEGPLFSLAVVTAVAAYAAYLDDRRSLGWTMAVLSLATLTRPEGLLLLFVTVAFESGRRCYDHDARRPSWLKPLAIFALGVVPHLAWRAWYYGALVPNTFHAKVGFSLDTLVRGFQYVRQFAVSGPGPLLVLPIALVLRRPIDARLTFAASLCVAYLGYVVIIGGDGLMFGRFITYVLPLLCLLAQEGLRTLIEHLAQPRPPWARAIGMPATTVVALLLVVGLSWNGALALLRPKWPWFQDSSSKLHFPGDGQEHSFPFFDQYFTARVARAGVWLDHHAPPDALIAANPAGIAYSLRMPVLDMLGLNDPVIARSRPPSIGRGRAGHERGDGRYVLSRKPEYILLGNVAVLPFPLDDEGIHARIYLSSERQIWDEASFHRDYERVVVRLEDRGPFQYFTFYRRR